MLPKKTLLDKSSLRLLALLIMFTSSNTSRAAEDIKLIPKDATMGVELLAAVQAYSICVSSAVEIETKKAFKQVKRDCKEERARFKKLANKSSFRKFDQLLEKKVRFGGAK